MDNVLVLGKINITKREVFNTEDKILHKIITLLSDFDLQKFEPNLSEDFNEELGVTEHGTILELNKYYFLTYLQAMFKEFQESGDEFLNVYKGKCGGDFCEFYNKKSYCIEGEKSKKRIAFVVSNINNEVLSEDEELRFAKGCDNFINMKGEKMDVDYNMYFESVLLLAEQLEAMDE